MLLRFKNDNQLKGNYRPISLLRICGKILEQVIYKKMFEFFTDNDIISCNQSGFQPRGLLHQSIIMYYSRYLPIFWWRSRDKSCFRGISKALDKVWHERLLYKLNQNGTTGNLVNIITDFLILRKQRVALNGQRSTWVKNEAGIP